MIATVILWAIKFMIVPFVGNVVVKLIKNPRRYFGM
ncbi:prophage P2b protein 5 [Lactiplantibacillus plantarum]|nr:prophage P2b protein 5 [Lactiplantibacillus plantarum]MCG0744078.1 prophage P2b protein 5 [Lactiplantibacillus plantarum]MCG0885489.1 prophage P2b protein 5 [Lactiplantibacillus plantarum]